MRSVKQVARMLSRQPAPPVRLRQGVVTDINADRTVDLTLGGVELTGVPCLTSAVPRVSSAVMVVISGRDMFVLGSVADNTAHAYTPLTQHGTDTLTTAASPVNTKTITFPIAYPSTPTVLVACSRGITTGLTYMPTVSSVTAADFSARVRVHDGSSNSEDIRLHWAAFQVGE